MNEGSDFYQADVLPHARTWSGFWGIFGEVFPVRSSDGRLSLEAVEYDITPLAPRGELLKDKALLALKWRLVVHQGSEIQAVREQRIGLAVVQPSRVDRTALTHSFTTYLSQLAAYAERQLNLLGWDEPLWPVNYLGGSEAPLAHVY